MDLSKLVRALIVAILCWTPSPVVADSGIAKRPIKMTSSEAESWLTGRGCTLKPDLQPDMPGWMIGWCPEEPKEITFMFAKRGDSQPATCITLAFNPTGTPDWRYAVKIFTGGDAAKLAKAPGKSKSLSFVLKTPGGPVKLLIGDGGRDVSIGDKCER
jgi:hypothetical protein